MHTAKATFVTFLVFAAGIPACGDGDAPLDAGEEDGRVDVQAADVQVADVQVADAPAADAGGRDVPQRDGGPDVPAPPSEEFVELRRAFDEAYAADSGRDEMLRYSNSGGTEQEHYYMNWNLNGVISAWQATGEEAFFDDARTVVDNTIAQAQPIEIDGETFMGWPEPGHPTGFELWDGMYWKEVATLLRIVHQSPRFLEGHRAWFDEVLAFTERNIWDRYELKGTDGNQYSYEADGTSHWARIAMELFVITGREKYETFFEQASFLGCECPETHRGSSIRDVLYDLPGVSPPAYGISWTWGETTMGQVPDAPHVSAVVQFMALAYELGMHWNAEDMVKWTNTYNNVVWIQNDPAVGFYFIDGTGEENNLSLAQGVQAILGRFDEAFQQRMERYILPNVFNKAMIAGLLLLNRKILDHGRPVYPEIYRLAR